MKNEQKVSMEYVSGTWQVIDGPTNRIKFDQAVVDITYSNRFRIDGFIISIHGVDQTIAQYLSSEDRATLGIKAVHRLGQGPTLRRVRLMENGDIERLF
jgi:hypothetical protein